MKYSNSKKIAYYSNVFFSDCDFPLIKEFQIQKHEVFYFLNVYKNHFSGGVLSSLSCSRVGIYKAHEISEFKIFDSYMNLGNIYVVNRSDHWYHPINIIITLQLFFFLLKNKIHVLHLTYELGISEFLLYFYPYKKVMTIHDPFSHSGEGSLYGERKRRFSFKMVDKLVLLNRRQEKDFINYYGLHQKEILHNHLGRYDCLNYFLSLKKQSSPAVGCYVLFFGHFSPYKGIKSLCEAMKRVHQTCPDLECIIAGKGSLDFDINPYLKDGYIRLINRFVPLEELAELIANCMFVVCPYKDATQSGVVASSFSLNKPVLATNVGGLSETVKNHVNGRIIPPNDIDALATAVCEMYTAPEQLKIFADNIEKNFSSGDFSWTEIAKRYIDFYNE